jgi:hypothetical protein
LRRGYPLSDLAGVESFFASMAKAQQTDSRDKEQARFHYSRK